MHVESAMITDTKRHRCTRCEQVGRGVDWQPLLGEYMHYECWLELAWENIQTRPRAKGTPRPQRIADALQYWFDLAPEQTELF